MRSMQPLLPILCIQFLQQLPGRYLPSAFATDFGRRKPVGIRRRLAKANFFRLSRQQDFFSETNKMTANPEVRIGRETLGSGTVGLNRSLVGQIETLAQ